MNKYRFHTASKVFSDLGDIKPADIGQLDIATSLSNLCRFNGQLPNSYFYSVAEHSVLTIKALEFVGGILTSNLKKIALLHDANEAFLGDIVRPVRSYLFYHYCVKELEEIFKDFKQRCYLAFNIGTTPEEEAIVKEADNIMLEAEGQVFFSNSWNKNAKYEELGKVMRLQINCLTPQKAKTLYIETFNEVFK